MAKADTNKAQVAKLFWDWTRGPQLGGEWDGVDDENLLAKNHAHNFADALLKLMK